MVVVIIESFLCPVFFFSQKLWMCIWIYRWNERVCSSMDRTRIEIFRNSACSGAARVCSRRHHVWCSSSFLDLWYRHWRRCIIFPRDIPLYCLLGNQKVWNYFLSLSFFCFNFFFSSITNVNYYVQVFLELGSQFRPFSRTKARCP